MSILLPGISGRSAEGIGERIFSVTLLRVQAYTSGAADAHNLRRKPGATAGGAFCSGELIRAAEGGDLLPQVAPRTRSAGAASDARKGGALSSHVLGWGCFIQENRF